MSFQHRNRLVAEAQRARVTITDRITLAIVAAAPALVIVLLYAITLGTK